MGCFTFEELLAASEGPELPAEIRRHVSDEPCQICARRLGLVRQLLENLPSLGLESPPPRVVSAALKTPVRTRGASPLILEALLPASSSVPAFRSGSSATARRRLYRSGPYELDLALEVDGTLLGELIHDAEEQQRTLQGECTLYGDRAVEHADLDAAGFFRFRSVRPGTHVLVIESSEALLVVPDMEIPA